MSLMRIERVLALPAILTGSTMYVVKSASAPHAELYFTNTAGTEARHLPTQTEIDASIAAAISSFGVVEVVADIAARDALAPTVNTQALVLNATADTTVLIGGATYIYDLNNTIWVKISEYESLDLVIQWAAIVGAPTSPVVNIDDAVVKRHSHTNLPVLELFAQDVNGDMTFNGVNPDAAVAVTDW